MGSDSDGHSSDSLEPQRETVSTGNFLKKICQNLDNSDTVETRVPSDHARPGSECTNRFIRVVMARHVAGGAFLR